MRFLLLLALFLLPFSASATPVSWDFSGGNLLQPLQSGWGALIKGSYFQSTSTTAINRFPNALFTNASSTNATTTALDVTSIFTFNGVTGNSWDDFCTTITGGSGLCDGVDATGASTGTISTSTDAVIPNLLYFTGPATVGNVATSSLTATSPLALSGTANIIATASRALSITADGITDTELAFNTGQHLTTLATPTFAGLTLTPLTSAILLTDGSGVLAEYAGTSCTNQFPRSLSALGVATCATVANTDLANSTVSYGGVQLSLGGTDATPAFDLTDATNLPIVAGTTGTLSIARGGTATTTAYDTGVLFYNSTLGTYSQASRADSNHNFVWDRTTPGVGIGTTTPWGLLSVNQNGQAGGVPQFVVGSSTATNFIVANTGRVGIGTTSPGTTFGIQSIANFTSATSTILSGFRTAATSIGSYLDVRGATAWLGTVLGAIDAGGATSFEIPNGTAPTVDATGETALDTTSDQFVYFGATAKKVLGNGSFYPSFSYATTSWVGTTTIPLGPAYVGETWNGVQCFTDVGTVNVSFYDGTNRMNMFNASTTVGTVTLSTNNTFTAAEKRYVDVGTPATSPTKIACTVNKSITAD